jgi:predicted nucleic acid-binding protein
MEREEIRIILMKKSVYIDTTIPSYYVDKRPELRIHIDRTRSWWDDEKKLYRVCTSEFTALELLEGKYPRQKEAVKLIEGIRRLKPSKEIDDIIQAYIFHKLMPQRDLRDALHLAFACFHNIDYLLTWNCEHLANVRKQEHIRIVNKRLHLKTPAIITPLELLPE